MVDIDIPGFGPVRLAHLVSDFTGTLSVDGRLATGVRELLGRAAGLVDVHILTADTFGRARAELEGIDCRIVILAGDRHDLQKEAYVRGLGADRVMAMGNGNNDRAMLRAARVGVAVCLQEGCAADATASADILVTSAPDALGLLLNPLRLKATLRF